MPKDIMQKSIKSHLKSIIDSQSMRIQLVRLDSIDTISISGLLRLDKTQWRNFAKLISYGFVFALFFSAWLYVFIGIVEGLDGFSQKSPIWLNVMYCIIISIFGLISVASYLFSPARVRLYFGFFAGLLLLYWIALSFRYSPFPLLIPLVWLGIGGIIGIIFWILLYFEDLVFRILTLMLLGSIHPFGFDWLIPQSFFAYSVFGVSNWDFFFIVVGVALIALALFKRDMSAFRFLLFSKKLKQSKKPSFINIKINIGAGFMGVISLLLALNVDGLGINDINATTPTNSQNTQNLAQYPLPLYQSLQDLSNQISLTQTHFAQDFKWNKTSLDVIKTALFEAINDAKARHKKIIVLPETILPFILNGEREYEITSLEHLKNASENIAIILGAFSKPNFNSTYVIYKGEVIILNKVILAPFGEKMPLPDIIAKPLLELFFGVSEGLDSALTPQDFTLFQWKFRNAICYEGTSQELYADNPSLVVMISNNGCFYQSIEPYLQRTLLKYRARKSNAVILHSANLSPSFMMTPKVLGDSFGNVAHIRVD